MVGHGVIVEPAMRLACHWLADRFPLIEGDEFLDLVEDIREHGVRERIELLDGAILDGRNRYRALVWLVGTGEVLGRGWGHRAGKPLPPECLQPNNPWFRKFNENTNGDALSWVVSKNLKRRHLNERQRAFIAAEFVTFGRGDNQHSEGLPIGRSSEIMNVAVRSVARARTVVEHGAPELKEAFRKGGIAVSTAEALTELPASEQAEIIAQGEKEVLAAAKKIRARQRKARFEQVNERLAEISKYSVALPTGQRFPLIYADPATRYVSGFSDRSVENHYPTMPIEELCALPVGDIAMDRCCLLIWTTIPQLRNTMRIIEAWGFTYISAWCWDKEVQGTGYWGFNQHEELLIATRGDFPAPVPGTQPRSLYREAKTEHSVKPAWFAEQIERIWPELPKIELFARFPRPGWVAWGNQARGIIGAQ